MNDWRILLLHTRQETLLKRAFEVGFPDRTLSLHGPALGVNNKCYIADKKDLVDYFRRQVYDSGVWSGRVLTIYGDGNYHHYTYPLTRLACNRRGLHSWDWTYFHFDNHRDDWGPRRENGEAYYLTCAGFVDSIAHDHRAIPFMVGPNAYAKKDSNGYLINGQKIPIYNNSFTQRQQKIFLREGRLPDFSVSNARKLPVRRDLEETPTESYLSFDLDVLPVEEIVTNYDQGDMTLRDLLRQVERVREYKRIFSADILGFPDDCHHPLSVLTTTILARKVMGLGVKQLLEYHTHVKRLQASLPKPVDFSNRERESPIVEEELMEVLKWTQ